MCKYFSFTNPSEKSTLKMNRKPDNTGCEFAGEKNKEFDDDAAYVKAEVAKGTNSFTTFKLSKDYCI